jgi:fatty acid desaturase
MGAGLARTGAEFRDDLRLAPSRSLPPELLRSLTELNDARSALAVLQTVGLLAALLLAGARWWTPWVVVPAVLLIATQQHAMFVLAHDAAHYRLFSNRALNDLVGRLLAIGAGLSMCTYRVVHRLHHNHLYGEQDPDIALHGGYPRGRRYLLRKLATDLTGLTAWKTYSYFFGAPAANAATNVAQRPLDDTAPALRRSAVRDRNLVVAVQIALPVIIAIAFGRSGLLKYLVLWVLPALTVLQAILRLRAIFEHGAPAGYDSPLRAARTNLAGPLARFALFPHHVNYHVEHHLFPAVPHYHLPRLHAELAERGALQEAEVRSPLQTWQRVYAAPAPD